MEQTEYTKIETWEDAYKRLVEGVGQRDADFILGFHYEKLKDRFPFIEVELEFKRTERGHDYKSTLEGFPNWLFETKLEANLANAIFLMAQTGETPLKRERFQMIFSLVLELLNVKSNWRQFV